MPRAALRGVQYCYRSFYNDCLCLCLSDFYTHPRGNPAITYQMIRAITTTTAILSARPTSDLRIVNASHTINKMMATRMTV